MARAYVNIGSNIGDRRANIAEAVTAVSALGSDVIVSEPVETAPWGYDSPNAFLNTGVSLDTMLSPEALMQQLLALQQSISSAPHRTPDGGYADRVIDIDLIAFEGVAVSTPALKLPHPRAHLRQFVILPLIDTLPKLPQ